MIAIGGSTGTGLFVASGATISQAGPGGDLAAEPLGHDYRFRKGYEAQGLPLSALPYRAAAFPFGPTFACVLCMTITLGQNYQAFLQERIDWTGVVATYIGLPLFLLVWVGYRWIKGSRIVPYGEMQVKPEAY